ncbi:MAG: mitochondrial ribosomal large subunit component [Trizodia sp. TS-e1964]|nr:MAG: mitochondrial ribosomal large subunit component [Trizodia sp. TS-e1964]
MKHGVISAGPWSRSAFAISSSLQIFRAFSTSRPNLDWLLPKNAEKKRSPKGRPRVCTGGSSRGTTVVWGDYGLRMIDQHRRLSAAQLKNGEETIRKRLRGLKYRLFKRICANIGVYTKGNESRMGKGKGSFDHWAARVAVSRVIFEIQGDLHERVVKEAFRLAANKLPGLYECIKKGDPGVVGITKLDGVTLEELKRPRRYPPLRQIPDEIPMEPLKTDHPPAHPALSAVES